MTTVRKVGIALSACDILPHLTSFSRRVRQHLPSQHPDQGTSLRASTQSRCIKVGLCVSGGPDSMALAYLLKTLPSIDEIKLDPMAFIVDHKARDGSTEEAQKVHGFLKRIGVPARVLTMTWPEGVEPLALSNFESQARYLRYRLIARSAIDEGINHLFVGHHQDDQVETVLMRLIRQQSPGLIGLRGIVSKSTIPCCDGIYGAHEQIEPPCEETNYQDPVSKFRRTRLSSHISLGHVQPSDPGGILLHRPLLAFPKLDLVATCEAYDVPYVVDVTNKNPRSNTRNAVRHMRSNCSLPRALSSGALLDLQASAQNSLDQTASYGAKELSRALINRLDLRTGNLEVTLPELIDNGSKVLRGLSDAILNLTEVVTPRSRSDRSLRLPRNVFDKLYLQNGPAVALPFTFHHVAFTPHATQPRTWSLSRQPMRESECLTNRWNFAPDPKQDEPTTKTAWTLWDNRFWIRLYTKDADLSKVVVAPFALYMNNTSLEAREDLEPYKKQLTRLAPGKGKLSLAVLVYGEHVIGFPTLDIKFSKLMSNLAISIDWEIRYKAVDCLQDLHVAGLDSRTCEKQVAADKTFGKLTTPPTSVATQPRAPADDL